MKKIITSLALVLMFAANTFAKTTPDLKSQRNNGISFTENKGQIHDQNYNPRPDVLYGVMAGNMAVHIKKTGVSYQLYNPANPDRVAASSENPVRVKPEHALVTESRLEAGQQPHSTSSGQTIYRIDLTWLNANTNFTKTEDEALAGYSNYYLENCPNGALKVRSYKGITLTNLYNGVNLHYYEKNGELKHDYIVAPHTDYKQIQLKVEGADISINKDGSLILTTPLGKIQEGAPIVYQNEKELKAKWILKKNTLSFEVESYNPNYELIIDPVTRMWGTYYGGGLTDIARSCVTDLSGNVYLAGYTNSTASGTIIATVGSHQTVLGSSNYDAFLVKLNGNGVRLWGTFYGGSEDDRAYSSSTDAIGNVFMVGVTNSNTGTNPIATAGSHQSVFGAVFNSTTDAFLVKFNSNGVRQWGTYYGGSGDDSGQSCATDASGNIYMAGFAESHFSIATGGSHQSVFGGGVYDGYLVKFNTFGVRQWATFYGNTSNDGFYCCATDPSGNIFLTGSTYTALGAIATPGCHQSAPGGNTDAFLVKFNGNGVRQWGTYYGGAGSDNGISCATDAFGNVFMVGGTALNTGSAIATPGSHQTTFAGGNTDAFMVKFNSLGVRQWGTYYGSATDDNGISCATDIIGNVYFAGGTSSNASAIFTTPGSHQVTYGGGGDAFLAKFDANGVRQSATYYGGTGNETAYSCTTDLSGSVYMAGPSSSGSGTVIATNGVHQPVFGGGNAYDAYLVKIDGCDVSPVQPSLISGSTITCEGIVSSYATPFSFGVSTYTLLLPGGGFVSSSSNTILTTPVSSGIFTLIAGNACGVSPEQTLNVTVNPNPTVTVNSGSICSGESFTLVASGADTYTYSAGAVVSPISTSVYSVTGTNSLGCSNTAVSSVTVIPAPIVTVNNGTICIGKSFTLVPSGAITYTFSSGPIISPTLTSSYTVTGVNSIGCYSSTVSNVIVNPLPTILISTSKTIMCIGEEVTLTASGATSYIFNPGGSGTSINVSPSQTSSYTVTGIDNNGCINTASFTQNVDECTGIKSSNGDDVPLSAVEVFPNPTNGVINLRLSTDYEITILNAIGEIVYSSQLKAGEHQITFNDLTKGIYVLRVGNELSSKNIKLIKD